MPSHSHHGIDIECIQGDITRQSDLDAVVNAANARLMPGGGVAGAIHKAAGPELARVCESLAPIRPGEAVITDAFNLPNSHIIHCLGPVYGADEPSDQLLADCYRNALRVAEKQGLASVGFPALSTGAFGYPMEDAAKVAMSTVLAEAGGLSSVKRVRFVLFSDSDAQLHQRVLEEQMTQAG